MAVTTASGSGASQQRVLSAPSLAWKEVGLAFAKANQTTVGKGSQAGERNSRPVGTVTLERSSQVAAQPVAWFLLQFLGLTHGPNTDAICICPLPTHHFPHLWFATTLPHVLDLFGLTLDISAARLFLLTAANC